MVILLQPDLTRNVSVDICVCVFKISGENFVIENFLWSPPTRNQFNQALSLELGMLIFTLINLILTIGLNYSKAKHLMSCLSMLISFFKFRVLFRFIDTLFLTLQMEPLEDKRNLQSEAEILVNPSSTVTIKSHTVRNSHFGSLVNVPQVASQRLLKNIYIVLIDAKINVLLPFGPLAVVLHYLTGKHVRHTGLSYKKV